MFTRSKALEQQNRNDSRIADNVDSSTSTTSTSSMAQAAVPTNDPAVAGLLEDDADPFEDSIDDQATPMSSSKAQDNVGQAAALAARPKTSFLSPPSSLQQPSSIYPKLPSPGRPRQQPTAPSATTPATRTSPVSMGDVTAFVKPFTGLQQADDWLSQFQSYASVKRLTGADLIDIFKLLMRDTAALWFTSLSPTVRASPQALFKTFLARFGLSDMQKWRVERELSTRYQQTAESVDEYITSMLVVGNRVGMPSDRILKLIIQGLKPELRSFVMNNRAQTIDEVLEVARMHESANGMDLRQSEAVSVAALTDIMTSFGDKIGEKLDKFADRVVAPTIPQVQAAIQPATTATPDKNRGRNSNNRNNFSRRDRPNQSWQRQQTDSQPPSYHHHHHQQQQHPWYPPQPTQWQQPVVTAPVNPPHQQWYEPQHSSGQQQNYQQPRQAQSGKCKFCAKFHAPGRDRCPASHATCANCHKSGHFKAVCYRPPQNPTSSHYNQH